MSELKVTKDLLRTKQEVVDVKNKLIDSQDRLQASLLDHKKTLEELVEVRAVLSWASDHCVMAMKKDNDMWYVSCRIPNQRSHPTLYQALHSAWEGRDK